MLFANADAFNRLNDAQRMVLRQAATAAQTKALAEHPQEVDASTAYCDDGGTIVLASDEQVAAFEQAAQPVFDNLAQDPLNAELIAAIRELKASTTPSAGAEACAPVATAPSPAPSADAQVWSPGLPPNGVWQVTLTTDDLVQMGDLRSTAAEWAGTRTLTFQDGNFINFFDNGHGFSAKCQANYAVVDDFVRFTFFSDTDECPGEVDDIQWRIDEEGLHLHLVAIQNSQLLENRAMYETKPWQKVEAWSPGLPPNGVWQVTETVDDFVRMGLLRSVAQSDWAGVTTLTLKDGKSLEVWKGESGKSGKCVATYEVVGEVVRFTYFGKSDECPGRVDDMQWRVDDQGLLHLHLVSTKNAPFIEIRSYLEAKPWQKVK